MKSNFPSPSRPCFQIGACLAALATAALNMPTAEAAPIPAQQVHLKASNTEAGDSFGISVAVSGDTLVVGAWEEDSNATGVNGYQSDNSATNSGAAYVFVRSGTNWIQQAYLKASNTEAGDNFGISVAVSGDTVVVGAYFESSNATEVNGGQGDNSASGSGAAYVFVRSGTNWIQQAYLKGSNSRSGDCFGRSVAVSGDTVVVGAFWDSSRTTGVNGKYIDGVLDESGAAYVFVRSGTNWSQQAYLKASNTGGRAPGEISGDNFGVSVAVSGDTVVVGALWEDGNAAGAYQKAMDSGAAYVFVRSGTNWSQQAYLKASNVGADDNFGVSVAVSGDTVVVGAWQEASNSTGVNGYQSDNSATNSGAAYVFVRSGTKWSQQAYLKASNVGVHDNFGFFGFSVAVSGDTVVVGAYGESSRRGATYVFGRSGTKWSQQACLKASNTKAYDGFGWSVAVAGDTVVVGTDAQTSQFGATYVFTGSGLVPRR